MILYVGTDTAKRYREGTGLHTMRGAIEDLAGDACLLLHYTQITPAIVAGLRPWAICHSGGGTDYAEYDVLSHPDYQAVIHESPVAQIGFCGGHQILAHSFGSRLGPIRRLRPGEPDPSPYSPGSFKEWGVYPVRIVSKDPLFNGCGRTIRVQEYHYWEVKRLAASLIRLAESADCRVQAFRHRSRPIYGTQFHPEQSPPAYPDGKTILTNFFEIAREHAKGTAGRG